MSSIEESDLLLISRGGINYHCTVADLKSALYPRPAAGVVQLLLIGGGGAGGTATPFAQGGGGGAGGVIYRPSYATGTGTYAIEIGSGGSNNGNPQGGDTKFAELTALGGGYGGVRGSRPASNGGSGGGGNGSDTGQNFAGSGTAGQGTNGTNGSTSSSPWYNGGAGGSGIFGTGATEIAGAGGLPGGSHAYGGRGGVENSDPAASYTRVPNSGNGGPGGSNAGAAIGGEDGVIYLAFEDAYRPLKEISATHTYLTTRPGWHVYRVTSAGQVRF